MIALDAALEFWLVERSPGNRERLVRTYTYLCVRGARKFLRAGLEKSDLEQVASIGLLKAADRYDPGLRTPFEAYAWLFIVGELMHHVRDHERIMRAPRKLRSLERRFVAACDALTMELSRVPTDVELARSLCTDVRTINELRQCRLRATAESIDASNPLKDEVQANSDIDQVVDRILIETALNTLTETERSIITSVYAGGLSQAEVAERLGYSQRHVSRLHKAALKKMLPVWVQ